MFIRHRIDRIERDIAAFHARAEDLLEAEQSAQAQLERAAAGASAPVGPPRRILRQRRLIRAQRRAERARDARAAFVEQQLRAIMLTLDEQSQRTRQRLDRELERLVPVQSEWERLSDAFATLEAAVGTPAVESVAGHWPGRLEIPRFPVHECDGRPRPFPEQAALPR